MNKSEYIKITKAGEHNLKNISLKIPTDKFTVITGVSGSGKSSLAFDTIFLESQRRYLSSLSGHARNFLGKAKSPKIGSAENLSPAIAVKQVNSFGSIKSTVGTISNIYDYLRLLFARKGQSVKHIKLTRALFSFNTPIGACSACKGLGVLDKIYPANLIKDPSKTIREGAFEMTTPSGYIVYSQVTMDVLDSVCRAEGFSVDIPWERLSNEQKNIIYYGSEKIKVLFGKHTLESRMRWSGITAKPREEGYYKGIVNVMSEILLRDRNTNILRFATSVKCPSCRGQRLNENALSVLFNNYNIAQLANMEFIELRAFLINKQDDKIAESIIIAIIEKLDLLIDLGLGYLSLGRTTKSLSTGELQRINIAVQTMGGLQNVCYVLDEPSMNLHPLQNSVMLQKLYDLQNKGNSVIVVEHNERFIKSSQHLLELGPLAGEQGGEIIYSGSKDDYFIDELPGENWNNLNETIEDKITSKNRMIIELLSIKTVNRNNISNIDVNIALNCLNAVTGVSGAGKSSFVEETLAASARNYFRSKQVNPGYCSEITGLDKLNQLVDINQKPIGKTIRSNVATYTKLFDQIRKLYAQQPLAKEHGWKASRFSFNTRGGRCEKCQGAGAIEIGMHLFSNIKQECSECNGKRFNIETRKIKFQGLDITDVLDLSITQAIKVFVEFPKIMIILNSLIDVGLGYIKLGQPSTTFSGGEAQRIKLATYLAKPHKQNTLYILDEPTVGLSIYDTKNLLKALQKLVDQQNTVIVVEHQPNIVLAADYLLELGPGSGRFGGQVIFNGNFKDYLKSDSIYLQAINNEPEIIKQSNHKQNFISIKGARTNNLKNIDLEIPHNKLTVITGRSGSGKSSLAYDTIYSEAHNLFMNHLSTFVRSKMSNIAQADVDELSGLTPMVAISQKGRSYNSRSTVATFSHLSDHIRLLFSRIAISKLTKNQISVQHFSANHHSGVCPKCEGEGVKLVADWQKIITNTEKSLLDGAMDGSKIGKFYGDQTGQYIATLLQVGIEHRVDFSKKWSELDAWEKELAMVGTDITEYSVNWQYKRKNHKGEHKFITKWMGIANLIENEYYQHIDTTKAKKILPLLSWKHCDSCQGVGLKLSVLSYKILDKSIADYYMLSVTELQQYLDEFKTEKLTKISQRVFEEVRGQVLAILHKIESVGLGYLTLNRKVNSLSGGEYQRLKIVSQLFVGLNGISYILDEPTLGLHSKDTGKLLNTLEDLIAQDNTVIVIEHDREVIEKADYIVEMGPAAGVYGGEVSFSGYKDDLLLKDHIKTAEYIINDPQRILEKSQRNYGFIEIIGATANNLKSLNLKIPKQKITAITGVSGSGKSSLVRDVIYDNREMQWIKNADEIIGLEEFDQILYVTQDKLPESTVSTIATYTKIFDDIRKLFGSSEIAKKRDLRAKDFSYLNKQTQCPECLGLVKKRISMDFMGDIWIDCDLCSGNRFIPEILDIYVRDKNISDILKMEIAELLDFFVDHSKIAQKLKTLVEVGLGYLQFGQTLSTLSGGENQRLKLALRLLSSKKSEKNLYLLDEPSTGLHISDLYNLLHLMGKLRDKGDTIIFIEHNPDLIINADYVIELGPVGGEKGGYLI